MKALVLANTRHADDYVLDDGSAQVDGSRVLRRDPYFGGTAWSDQPNSMLTDNQWVKVTTKYMWYGYKKRVVLSWMHDPDRKMRMDLKVVSPNGTVKAITYGDYSTNPMTPRDATFRIVEFDTTESGNYDFYVKRTRNDSFGGTYSKINLGLAFVYNINHPWYH